LQVDVPAGISVAVDKVRVWDGTNYLTIDSSGRIGVSNFPTDYPDSAAQAKLDSMLTELQQKLETADLSIEATTKYLQTKVMNLPTDYFKAGQAIGESPVDVKYWTGTAWEAWDKKIASIEDLAFTKEIGRVGIITSSGGGVIDPRQIRALTSSDVVSAVQSGTWTVGRTWSLGKATDGVSAKVDENILGFQFLATEPTPLTADTPNLYARVDAYKRLLVAAVQSGTWNINAVTSITNPVTVQATDLDIRNLSKTLDEVYAVLRTDAGAAYDARDRNWSLSTTERTPLGSQGQPLQQKATTYELQVDLKALTYGTLPIHEQTPWNPPNLDVALSTRLADSTFTGRWDAGIYGWDGSTARKIKTDASGELQVDILTMPSISIAEKGFSDSADTPTRALVDGDRHVQTDVLTLPVTKGDWLSVIPNPSNLDVALSTRASESTLSGIKAGTDYLDDIYGRLDVALSTRASESTLSGLSGKFPSAVALADNLSNPTTTIIGVANLGWDGTYWRRLATDTSSRLRTVVESVANPSNLDVALSTRASESTLSSFVGTPDSSPPSKGIVLLGYDGSLARRVKVTSDGKLLCQLG
jgi:hypothetical protein